MGTNEQEKEKHRLEVEIRRCKMRLAQTDYLAIKHADGVLSDEEYEPDKIKRDEWRSKINENEERLAQEAQLKQGE